MVQTIVRSGYPVKQLPYMLLLFHESAAKVLQIFQICNFLIKKMHSICIIQKKVVTLHAF